MTDETTPAVEEVVDAPVADEAEDITADAIDDEDLDEEDLDEDDEDLIEDFE